MPKFADVPESRLTEIEALVDFYVANQGPYRRFVSALHGQIAEQEFLVAEGFDGVAEFGGFFEFEVFGGFAHVGFEVGDVGVEGGLIGEGPSAFR